jgi:hypothetical protein
MVSLQAEPVSRTNVGERPGQIDDEEWIVALKEGFFLQVCNMALNGEIK